MMPHPLDRPVWHALDTLQAPLSVGSALARSFAPDIAPLAAARDETPEWLTALAGLVTRHGNALLLQAGESAAPAGTIVEKTAAGVQMVAYTPITSVPDLPMVPLGEADAAEMLALARLTAPGPFEQRTHLLGGFWGVRENGRLVAMAGERLRLPGFTEVSGVCTHPDARGRGYARALSAAAAARIFARGEVPFLHAYAANTAAIGLYEALGFALRSEVVVTVLRAQDGMQIPGCERGEAA